MYSFMRGIIREASPAHVILEAGGIGYKIFIPLNVFSKLPGLGEETLIHTSYVVREISAVIYGFIEAKERDIFESLQNVSGIGPKIALSLIGHLGIGALHTAIHHEDVAALCKVPGVGKKTAERMIIELRDKLAYTPAELTVKMPSDPHKAKISDAMNALVNLGYNNMTAQKALKKSLQEVPESIDLAALITHALKNV